MGVEADDVDVKSEDGVGVTGGLAVPVRFGNELLDSLLVSVRLGSLSGALKPVDDALLEADGSVLVTVSFVEVSERPGKLDRLVGKEAEGFELVPGSVLLDGGLEVGSVSL